MDPNLLVMQRKGGKEVPPPHPRAQTPQQVKHQEGQASKAALAAVIREKVKIHGSTGILAHFLDPLNHKPIRLPDLGSVTTQGTAVATLASVSSLNWTSEALVLSQTPYVPNDEGGSAPLLADPLYRMAASFRDPCCMGAVTEGPWSLASPTVYTSVSRGNAVPLIDGELPVKLNRFEYMTGPKRYGDYNFPCLVDGGAVQAVWVDAGPDAPAGISIRLDLFVGVPDNSTYRATARIYTDDQAHIEIQLGSATVAAGATYLALNGSLNYGGYIAFFFRVEDMNAIAPTYVNDYTVTITTKTTTSTRHVFHPSIVTAIAGTTGQEQIGMARVLGQSFLASNTTAEMFKSGAVYARQVDGHQSWYEACGSPEVFTTANVAATYDGPLSKGLYAITKPQGPECLDLEDVVSDNTPAGTQDSRVAFRPFRTGGTVVALFVPSAPLPNTPATTLLVHWCRGFEFTTQSQLYKVDTTTVARAEMLTFLDSLCHSQQFYENPLHWKQIKEALARAGSWAWKNKSEIGSVAQMLATLAARAAL